MEIIKINLSHLEAFKTYVEECIDDGLDMYIQAQNDSDAFLKKLIACSEGRELPDGWVPMSMYFCIESGEILGAIRVRHGSNEYINNVVGHIGYETLPQARGKGVATKMLTWIKQNAMDDTAIITCNVDNVGSKTVIEKCGGQYLDTVYSTEKESHVLRYQLVRT
ncbi:GNAT family N-acetyltransferase [Vibrio sp. SA48]